MDLVVPRQRQKTPVIVQRRRCDDLLHLRIEQARKVRNAAIDIRKAVLSREVGGEEDEANLAASLRVHCKSHRGAADQQGSFRLGKEGILGDAITPVLLANTEVFEDRLRAQETGRQAQGRNAGFHKFHGPASFRTRAARSATSSSRV
jgi:hypothetical protein